MSGYRPVQSPALQRHLQHPGYSYREYIPNHDLAPYIACYWTVNFHADTGNQLHRIIPDGCIDIIVDRLSPSNWKAAFVEGIMTRFEVLNLSAAQSIFGIRFFLEAAQSFLHYPISACMRQHVFLEEIWGMEGAHFVESTLAANTVPEMIEIVEHKLKRVLSRNGTPSSSLLHASMQAMYACKGNMLTSELAKKLSFSERHIRRTFVQELGISPKEVLGIIRFQSMLQELHTGLCTGFTDMAIKSGYYDQSHFIKSFKRYYGILPKQVTKTD